MQDFYLIYVYMYQKKGEKEAINRYEKSVQKGVLKKKEFEGQVQFEGGQDPQEP